MAKVLFVNPVIRQEENPRYVPYGIAQLAAIASEKGHKVQVFDANAHRPSEGEIISVFASDDWDVIAIGGLVTTYAFIKKAVKYARKACKDSLIVAGGGFITPIPREVMAFLPEIDIGVIGEGYATLPEILEMVDRGERDWAAVEGIAFRDAKGGLRLNRLRPLLEDVDSLPFPAWEMFPLDIYFKNSALLLSEEAMLAKRHIGLLASYGCHFRCKYCFHLGLSGELKMDESAEIPEISPGPTRKVRCHSPGYVTDLVKEARRRYGIDFVSFLDENFAMLAKRPSWFAEFSRLWKDKNLQPACVRNKKAHDPSTCRGVHWGTTAHPAVVNPAILASFRELGCSHLDYGLESFSDRILRSIGKCSTAKQNEKAVVMTMRAGIRPVPNQIIGFPEETFESIRANMEAWKRLGIQSFPFFATPYPGSEWYYTYKERILEQYGGSLEDFLLDLGDATKITAVISENFDAVELLGLRELMAKGDLKRLAAHEWRRKKEQNV